MESTIYKPGAYKSPGIYNGAGGIYKGIGVYNDGATPPGPPLPEGVILRQYVRFNSNSVAVLSFVKNLHYLDSFEQSYNNVGGDPKYGIRILFRLYKNYARGTCNFTISGGNYNAACSINPNFSPNLIQNIGNTGSIKYYAKNGFFRVNEKTGTYQAAGAENLNNCEINFFDTSTSGGGAGAYHVCDFEYCIFRDNDDNIKYHFLPITYNGVPGIIELVTQEIKTSSNLVAGPPA